MTTVGLLLSPLDVWFFRDGRPFAASLRAATGLPTPQVLAGALRAALLDKYGCSFSQLRNPNGLDFAAAVRDRFPGRAWIGGVRFRGPWFALRGEPLVPAPATLHAVKKADASALHRLLPLKADDVPGWDRKARHNLRPLWLRHDEATEPAGGFLTLCGARAFLNDQEVPARERLLASDLFGIDSRTGIEVQPDRLTAAEGQIYSVSLLAPQKDVALYAEAVLPGDAPPDAFEGAGVVALGGEGRRAAVNSCHLADWPSVTPTAGQKPFVLLTTPCLSRGGWRPAALTNLSAAAVASPLAVSGWDLARGGPRPARFAAPAGSVYFLEGSANLSNSLADSPDDAALGLGCYLQGVWTDA